MGFSARLSLSLPFKFVNTTQKRPTFFSVFARFLLEGSTASPPSARTSPNQPTTRRQNQGTRKRDRTGQDRTTQKRRGSSASFAINLLPVIFTALHLHLRFGGRHHSSLISASCDLLYLRSHPSFHYLPSSTNITIVAPSKK